MKQKLKLEVGKYYRNKAGGIIQIVDDGDGILYPFTGDDYEVYAEDGRFFSYYETKWDLICEVSDPILIFIHPRTELLSISAIEAAAGMPSRTLYKFLKGTRGLPKKHRAPLIEILKKVGYND